MSERLIFVYNADSGRLHAWLDIGHKLLSPHTYQCDLCRVTHGVFREHRAWKAFRERSGIPLEFLHRDEFEARYPLDRFDYPVVLRENADGERVVVLSPTDLRGIDDVADLIRALPGS